MQVLPNVWTGIFLFNSNAMDIIIQPAPMVTWRTVGGILDFYIFVGFTPEEVVQQYINLVGLPLMPPFWSLGFHLSRYGYKSLDNLKKVWNRTRQAGIPFDVQVGDEFRFDCAPTFLFCSQWTDIDMFQSNNDFSYDQSSFKGMPEFVDDLHSVGMRFVPMFDCGISAGEDPPESYLPYKEGLEMNIFVKNASNQILLGKVWNAKLTVWPDFFHPNASEYWTQQFSKYHEVIAFDGAWIDMNEPSNFYDGSVDGCPKGSKLESPPYTPGMVSDELTLAHHTLCMSAKHANGQVHYDLHNLYSLSEAVATNHALRAVLQKRPFIISRSTFAGHGYWGSHWTGDIVSDWDSMKWSIACEYL